MFGIEAKAVDRLRHRAEDVLAPEFDPAFTRVYADGWALGVDEDPAAIVTGARTETEAAIDAAIASSGAESIRDMGKVMAALKGKFTGQMDFAKVGPAVKKRLS